MSDPFDFQSTPLERLQRHDHPYWRSPFGVVHTDRCSWCFSACEGWTGFYQIETALGKYGRICHECVILDNTQIASSRRSKGCSQRRKKTP